MISAMHPTTTRSGTANTPIELRGKRVHFIGIGGCGMSGLAHIAAELGATCTGSDMAASPATQQLQERGIAVKLEQSSRSVPEDADMVVASAAIRPDHPEFAEATRRGLPVLKYAQMLGQLMLGRTGVAIAGTHGKSTTTSMLCHVLIQTGLDPSFIVGATCRQIGGGSRAGRQLGKCEQTERTAKPEPARDILVAEACEFDRSFHHLHPTHATILNVEEDHMEIYGSLDAIVESFATFAGKLPRHGSLLINHEMPHRLAITAGLDCTVETIGFAPQADWRVELVAADTQPTGASRGEVEGVAASDGPQGRFLTRLHHGGQLIAQWRAPVPGEHMAYNAAAAAVTAHRLGATWPAIAAAVAAFQGLDRRMQMLGEKPIRDGAFHVIDDYGHHPTEVDTTLRALRQHYQPRRLICIFQPHQHSRTRFLMEQFAQSFSQADIVIVPHIYFVRDSEQERHAVQAGDLVDRIRQRGGQAMHLYPFDVIVEQLQLITQPGDLVVTMGAGDVWKIARDLLAV